MIPASDILYITADRIDDQTGGGVVTRHEKMALEEFASGDVSCPDHEWLHKSWTDQGNVWVPDERAYEFVSKKRSWKLAHFYSGSFPRTAEYLKSVGCTVTYTVAAHDREVSRAEHEAMGFPFPYPHLVDPMLWNRYVIGYALADAIICPSRAAERTVRGYGPYFESKVVRIIPHGCEIPGRPVVPLPERFTVGYLGAIGPDKGLRYLLAAWKKLAWEELLVIAGRDSISSACYSLVERYGGGNICLAGWQKNVSDFYDSVSLYVQPSATEGFGVEILEAMAHGRPVLCSDAAACECIGNPNCVFPARDAYVLADMIDGAKEWAGTGGIDWRGQAEKYTWGKVRARYVSLWRELLS